MLGLTRNVQMATWFGGPRLTTYYEKFTTSTTWTAPTGVSSIKLLVVAGGGSGAFATGGGGGAGGARYSVSNVTPGTTYTITIGAGAAKSTVDGTAGARGANTTVTGTGFSNVSSTGGGYGAAVTTAVVATYGGDGGSGGGSGYINGNSGTAFGGGVALNGNGVEGYYGGNAYDVDMAVYGNNYPYVGGGGGGAGGGSFPYAGPSSTAGQSNWLAGSGGDGILNANVGGLINATSSGVSGRIAAGGGGAANWSDDLYGVSGNAYAVPGLGGVGGGGNGGECFAVSPYATHYSNVQARSTTMASSGVVNTGSGGGAGQEAANGAGGSGIVILSYTV